MSNISQQELEKLLDAQKKLLALENAGVDNWEGYGIALEEYYATKEKEQAAYDVLDSIMEELSNGVYEPSEHGAGIAFHEESIERARALILELV